VDTIEHGQQLALDLTDELAAYGGSLIPTLFDYRQIAEKSEIPEYARAKARALLPEHEGAVEAARTVGVLIGAGSDAGSPLTPTAP
jgi:imidazolonepropionase-like amidohydrolase